MTQSAQSAEFQFMCLNTTVNKKTEAAKSMGSLCTMLGKNSISNGTRLWVHGGMVALKFHILVWAGYMVFRWCSRCSSAFKVARQSRNTTTVVCLCACSMFSCDKTHGTSETLIQYDPVTSEPCEPLGKRAAVKTPMMLWLVVLLHKYA